MKTKMEKINKKLTHYLNTFHFHSQVCLEKANIPFVSC